MKMSSSIPSSDRYDEVDGDSEFLISSQLTQEGVHEEIEIVVEDHNNIALSGGSENTASVAANSVTAESESSIDSGANTTTGFHEDLIKNTFGKYIKNGVYWAASDFRFDLVCKLICCESENTGYIISVYPESEGQSVDHMESYVRTNTVHRRDHFISCINQACEGGLTCSFTDKELTQFWQHKKRVSGSIPTKFAVATVGKQADGKTWVLSKDIQIDSTTGKLVPPEDSQYVWLSHLFRGRGIASSGDAVKVPLPLTTNGLLPLVEAVTVTMKHNGPPGLMVLGSGCIALHYGTIIDVNGECPAPLIVGEVGTGKSLSLKYALAMIGCVKSRFYSRGTREKYSLLLGKSTFPVGIDDPKNPHSTGELLVDLFQGGKSTTVAHGDVEPISTGIITANFDMSDKAKYYTRAVIIPFSEPPLGQDLSADELQVFSTLSSIFAEASRAVGHIIYLGHLLKESGFVEIRTQVYPFVKEALGGLCHPRVIMGYAVMLWFTYKILDAAALEHLKEDVNNHFVNVTASQIQSIHKQSPAKMSVTEDQSCCSSHLLKISKFIEELIDKFSQDERSKFARSDLSYTLPTGEMQDVFAFRYENVKQPLSFTKKEFVNAVAFGKLGLTNKRKQIGASRDKCTLVFISSLSEELKEKVIKEFPGPQSSSAPGSSAIQSHPATLLSTSDQSDTSSNSVPAIPPSICDQSDTSSNSAPAIPPSISDQSDTSSNSAPVIPPSISDQSDTSSNSAPAIPPSIPNQSDTSSNSVPAIPPSICDQFDTSSNSAPAIPPSISDQSDTSSNSAPVIPPSISDQSDTSSNSAPAIPPSISDQSDTSSNSAPAIPPSILDQSDTSSNSTPAIPPSNSDQSDTSSNSASTPATPTAALKPPPKRRIAKRGLNLQDGLSKYYCVNTSTRKRQKREL